MPINREHAFADGVAYGRPRRRWFRPLPWTVQARVAAAWTQFEAKADVAAGCRLGPNAWCVNNSGDSSRLTLGSGAICRGLLRIERFDAGRITIGSHAYIGDDCLLASSVGISISDHVLIAHGVQIFDNDSHPLDSAARAGDYASVLSSGERAAIASAPITIGPHAWIGFDAIILKGVNIGAGSVVAAGSVVTHDVPAGAVAAGNPARIIRSSCSPSTPPGE